MSFTKDDLIARYYIFDKYALRDQRLYYRARLDEYRTASTQVNRFRSFFSFLAAVVAGAAVFCITIGISSDGGVGQFITSLLAIASIVLPVFASFFSMLADLYQWDRFADIYESAVHNLELADAQLSQPEEIDDETYLRAAYTAFVSGALDVMTAETAQWGQVNVTMPSIEAFIEAQRAKDAQVRGTFYKPKTDSTGLPRDSFG